MCMCGDTHCWSCGPAQGNHRCSGCGEWMDDHGEHVSGPFVMGDEIKVVRGRLKGEVGVVHKINDASYGFYSRDTYDKLRWVDARRVEEGDVELVTPREGCRHDDTQCQEAVKAQAEAEADEWLAEMRDSDPPPGAP